MSFESGPNLAQEGIFAYSFKYSLSASSVLIWQRNMLENISTGSYPTGVCSKYFANEPVGSDSISKTCS